jgi:hypothetical protein
LEGIADIFSRFLGEKFQTVPISNSEHMLEGRTQRREKGGRSKSYKASHRECRYGALSSPGGLTAGGRVKSAELVCSGVLFFLQG